MGIFHYRSDVGSTRACEWLGAHRGAGEHLFQHFTSGAADKRVRLMAYQSLRKLGSRNGLDLLSDCLDE